MKHGDKVFLRKLAPSSLHELPDAEIRTRLLFEDDHLMVLDKPSGARQGGCFFSLRSSKLRSACLPLMQFLVSPPIEKPPVSPAAAPAPRRPGVRSHPLGALQRRFRARGLPRTAGREADNVRAAPSQFRVQSQPPRPHASEYCSNLLPRTPPAAGSATSTASTRRRPAASSSRRRRWWRRR